MKKSKPSSNTCRALVMHINDGVTWYRHMAPVKQLGKMDWSIAHPRFDWGKSDWDGFGADFGHSPEDLDRLKRSMDILITQRNDIPQYIAESSLTQALYRVPWVLDTDDNVHAIRPTSMGFKSYNPTSYNPVWAIKALESAFAVTVSTQNLKEVYSKTNKRIYVLPNGIDFDLWDSAPLGREHPNEIRISMVLSGSHFEDMYDIDDVLCEILERNDNVRLYVMDAFRGTILHKLSPDARKRVVWTTWVNPKKWIEWNKKMNFDIGLAPLLDNDFNRAKSNLRWLEYSAAGIPTIASDVEPYRCANDGENILFARNDAEWYDKLSLLINDAALRKRIGKNANQKVRAEYNMKDVGRLYDKTYREIIKDFRELYGEPVRDGKLFGANQAAIGAQVDKLADDILEGNCGRRENASSKFKPEWIRTTVKRPSPVQRTRNNRRASI